MWSTLLMGSTPAQKSSVYLGEKRRCMECPTFASESTQYTYSQLLKFCRYGRPVLLGDKQSPFVFTTRAGSRIIDINMAVFNKFAKKLQERGLIKTSHFVSHNFRTSFASWGKNLEKKYLDWVPKVMNHSTATSEKFYQVTASLMKSRLVDRMVREKGLEAGEASDGSGSKEDEADLADIARTIPQEAEPAKKTVFVAGGPPKNHPTGNEGTDGSNRKGGF